jgi:dTDP-4-dehydrorhamnose 3,5-epimerase
MEKDVKSAKANPDPDPVAAALLGAVADRQTVTHDWQPLQELIAGVQVKEVKNVIKDNGYLTEIWREDWPLAPAHVGQVFQALIEPAGISAWHVHRTVTDRLFANHGLLKIVLYDARPDSSTHGSINVFRCGSARPMLIVIPAGVWHGVQNLSDAPALLLNLPDQPYRYETPDHWRLPQDTDRIPYSFTAGARPNSDDPGRI